MEDSNNILRPEYFDWDEDVENESNNEFDGYNWSMPIDEFPNNAPESPLDLDRCYLEKEYSIKECDEDEAISISQGDMVTPGSPLSRFYLTRSGSIEVLKEDDSCLRTDAENSTAMTSLATGAGPFIVDGSQRNEDLEEDSRDQLDIVNNDIREVFRWRDRRVLYNPETHHFNWFNEPVYTRSGTPPSVSLVIIHAEPKTPEVKENYRVMSTLHRALGFIDPVVVDLVGADDNLLDLRGSQLQQAATGRTHRYYSRHGLWMDDPDEDPDIDVDIGIDHFYSSSLAVGNGFTRSVIRTASEWLTARQMIRTFRSKSRLPKKRGCLPSPLRQMWLASEVMPEIKRKAVSEGSQQLVRSVSKKRVQHPVHRSRTPCTDAIFTDPSRDPNLHN